VRRQAEWEEQRRYSRDVRELQAQPRPHKRDGGAAGSVRRAQPGERQPDDRARGAAASGGGGDGSGAPAGAEPEQFARRQRRDLERGQMEADLAAVGALVPTQLQLSPASGSSDGVGAGGRPASGMSDLGFLLDDNALIDSPRGTGLRALRRGSGGSGDGGGSGGSGDGDSRATSMGGSADGGRRRNLPQIPPNAGGADPSVTSSGGGGGGGGDPPARTHRLSPTMLEPRHGQGQGRWPHPIPIRQG
jgi:hypothetical protein